MLTPESIKAMTTTQAHNTLKLAYKALGLLNKLTRSETVTKLKKRLFGNINRLRAIVKKAPKLYDVYDRFGKLRATQLPNDYGAFYGCFCFFGSGLFVFATYQ